MKLKDSVHFLTEIVFLIFQPNAHVTIEYFHYLDTSTVHFYHLFIIRPTVAQY